MGVEAVTHALRWIAPRGGSETMHAPRGGSETMHAIFLTDSMSLTATKK